MKLGSVSENLDLEKRISITPEIAKKYINLGFEVYLNSNYGKHLGFDDEVYKKINVKILRTPEEVIKISDLIIQLNLLSDNKNLLLKENQILIGVLNPYVNKKKIENQLKKKDNIFY